MHQTEFNTKSIACIKSKLIILKYFKVGICSCYVFYLCRKNGPKCREDLAIKKTILKRLRLLWQLKAIVTNLNLITGLKGNINFARKLVPIFVCEGPSVGY
eukprot:GHVP01032498.1.p1 GENE.GHVP01032498.1~~GHVP01032498.1.p1  ORF type:complete len:101 (+),score=2.76 GHVP01032498.1:87-389(+)